MAAYKTHVKNQYIVTMTFRFMVKSEEIDILIGRNEAILTWLRQESGAKISISDGLCLERIVTVTGLPNTILKAFSLICKRFEEFQELQSGGGYRPPITLHLIVPVSICACIIGQGGAKIREIRNLTGVSIQVPSNSILPNSTERDVPITGTSDAITQCIMHICHVMLKSSLKGNTVPYRPIPIVPAGPVIVAGGNTYTMIGNYAVPISCDISKMVKGPLAGHAAPGLNTANTGLNPAALAGSQPTINSPTQKSAENENLQTLEMKFPQELIGNIMGMRGHIINLIRQITGSTISVTQSEEGYRTVIITGTPDAVTLGQYFVKSSIEFQKANLEAQNPSSPGGSSGTSSSSSSSAPNPLDSNSTLVELLSMPGALNAISSLNARGVLKEFLEGCNTSEKTTGIHYSKP